MPLWPGPLQRHLSRSPTLLLLSSLSLFKSLYSFSMCMCLSFMHNPCVRVCLEAREASDGVELELQAGVSLYVGAGNRAWIPYKSSHDSRLPSCAVHAHDVRCVVSACVACAHVGVDSWVYSPETQSHSTWI